MRLLVCVIFLFLCGCDKGKTVVRQTGEETAAVRQRAEFALQSLDRRMAALRSRGEASSEKVRIDVRRALDELEERKTTVLLEMEKLKTSTGQAARSASQGVDRAVQELEQAAKDAVEKFK